MGLLISIYRAASATRNAIDCTNGGVSAKGDNLCVVNIEGPFRPGPDVPAVTLESHVRGALRLVPVERGSRHVMFGGNYGATSDGRFSRKCEELLGHAFYGAVPIHDRIE